MPDSVPLLTTADNPASAVNLPSRLRYCSCQAAKPHHKGVVDGVTLTNASSWFPREVAPSLYELIVSTCLRAVFTTTRFIQAPQIASSLGMVGAGCGIALIPESMCFVNNPNITFCEIENNTLFTDIAFAWRHTNPSRAVMHLLSLIN